MNFEFGIYRAQNVVKSGRQANGRIPGPAKVDELESGVWRTTHKNDETREWGVADQGQEVIPVAGHQDVVAVIRVSEHVLIPGGRRQDFTQADDLVVHRFQCIRCIFGDIMVEEENHASGCI